MTADFGRVYLLRAIVAETSFPRRIWIEWRATESGSPSSCRLAYLLSLAHGVQHRHVTHTLLLPGRKPFPAPARPRLLALDEADDKTVWQHAKANDFVVVTQDSDFADMAALYGHPPKVIWLRCGNQPTEAIEKRLRDHAQAIAAFELDATATCLEIL